MRSTATYAAKRALIDRLTLAAGTTGDPLYGVQVGYLRPGNIAERAIYGGGGRFLSGDADAEGQWLRQTVTTAIYVQVLSGADPRQADEAVEALGDAVVDELTANPELAGGLSFARVVGGSADTYLHDGGQVEVILALSIEIDAWLE